MTIVLCWGGGGCRDYEALDRTTTLPDASASDAFVADLAPADLAPLQPDLAPYRCDAGILCETFDNDPIGDDWGPVTTMAGMAAIDTSRAYAGPSSLHITVPVLTSGSASPGFSHAFMVAPGAVELHARELFYLPSTLTAAVDLFRFGQSGTYNALWLQAVPQANGSIEFTVSSTSGGAAMDEPTFRFDQWNCIEWTLASSTGTTSPMFTSTIAINDDSSPAHPGLVIPFTASPDTLILGDQVSSSYAGASYWIDSLVVSNVAIGCP